jgi:hypothetical protein
MVNLYHERVHHNALIICFAIILYISYRTLIGTLLVTYASYTVSLAYKALQGLHDHCERIQQQQP